MAFRYSSFGYDGASPISDDPEMACEICGDYCGDDWVFFDWPGAHYEHIVCPVCYREEVERINEHIDLYFDTD